VATVSVPTVLLLWLAGAISKAALALWVTAVGSMWESLAPAAAWLSWAHLKPWRRVQRTGRHSLIGAGSGSGLHGPMHCLPPHGSRRVWTLSQPVLWPAAGAVQSLLILFDCGVTPAGPEGRLLHNQDWGLQLSAWTLLSFSRCW